MKKLISILLLFSLGLSAQVSKNRLKTSGYGWVNRVVPTNAYLDSTFSSFWMLEGNSVSTNTNFIGTTSNRSLLFKTNNTQRLKIDSINRAIFTTTLTIKDGSEGAGKVLTSDANGVCTWSTVSGGGGSFVPYSGATGTVDLNNKDLGNIKTLKIGAATGTNTTPLVVMAGASGSGLIVNSVGGTGLTDANTGIVCAKVYDPTTAENGHGFVCGDVFTKNSGINQSHASYKDISSYGGATTDYGHHSVFENAFAFSGRTLGDLYTIFDGFSTNSGTVTNRYGHLFNDASGPGVLRNQYGLYVGSLSKGTTSNYAIYVAGSSVPSHFRGPMQFASGSGSAGAKTPTVGFYHGSSPQIISYFQSEWNGQNDKITFYNAKYNLASWKEAFYIKGATTAANLNDTIVVNSTNYKSFSQYNYLTGRLIGSQGSDVASATGSIAVGSGGNVFEITGTNAITLIESSGWQNGAEITLLFTSTASLTDGTANSGTLIGFELAGNTNFTGSSDDTITLILCEIGGTQRWREKCRSVN